MTQTSKVYITSHFYFFSSIRLKLEKIKERDSDNGFLLKSIDHSSTYYLDL